eukprot:2199651-Prorocentrum_lima.AAC.1
MQSALTALQRAGAELQVIAITIGNHPPSVHTSVDDLVAAAAQAWGTRTMQIADILTPLAPRIWGGGRDAQ